MLGSNRDFIKKKSPGGMSRISQETCFRAMHCQGQKAAVYAGNACRGEVRGCDVE